MRTLSECESCGRTYQFPDYKEYRANHYTFPEDNPGGNRGVSYGVAGYTAVCPFCGNHINHGDINYYPKEAEK